MRLVLTDGSDKAEWVPRLRTRRGDEPYAILSHRWYEDSDSEILFADIEEIDESVIGPVKNSQYAGVDPRTKPAFFKLRSAAQRALRDGYSYVWVDTCCIDKNSSAELSEAINSMFEWYSASGICYVYLVDCTVYSVTIEEGKTRFASSTWWKRGWTLQELLAPRELIFFSSTWVQIGRKDDSALTTTISEISGIDVNVVNGTIPLDSISVAQRMSWAANRITSRVEDIAYSLMGIFSVNMPLLYGEGERAFLRLQQEIMKESDDETIFAWRDGDSQPRLGYDDAHILSGLLATHPSAFRSSRSIVQYHAVEDGIPFAMTNNGLSISLRLEDAGNSLFAARLHCVDSDTNAQVGIYLKRVSASASQYGRVHGSGWASVEPRAQMEPLPLYVKQHHDRTPAYKELNHGQRKIRLIQVLPSEDTSIMKLRLLSADIGTAKYTALSYVWGPSGQVCNIWLNSEQVAISEKIFLFLQKARCQSMNTLFWIDAVCIRQQDNRERRHQVVLMAEIYRHASQVVVLLDKIAPSTTEQYKEVTHSSLNPTWTETARIRDVDNRRAPQQHVSDPQLADNIAALTEIAKHNYWKRLWLVQDFLVARDIALQLDTRSIPISSFAQTYFASIAAMKQQGFYDASLFRYMEPFLRYARSTERFNLEAEGRHANKLLSDQPLRIKFQELLDAFQLHQCTDPRDRVHALINVSDLGLDFAFYYTASTKDLLFAVVAARGHRLPTNTLSLLQNALNVYLSKEDLVRLHKIMTGDGETVHHKHKALRGDRQ